MKYLFLTMICYLQSKPKVGITSGLGGGLLYSVHNFFTSDDLMKVVSNVGICASTLVALMSVLAWTIKTYRLLKTPNKS
jgi:uncharacterized membrane protein (UPF0136 family)